MVPGEHPSVHIQTRRLVVPLKVATRCPRPSRVLEGPAMWGPRAQMYDGQATTIDAHLGGSLLCVWTHKLWRVAMVRGVLGSSVRCCSHRMTINTIGVVGHDLGACHVPTG